MLGVVENHSLPRTAAFFDLDKTVIAKSSTLAFSRSFYQGGLINRRAVLRARTPSSSSSPAAPTTTRWSGCAQYLSALCTGWDVQQVQEIVAETLHDLIDPIIYDEAASLIEEHHTAGRDVVIVSTSGAEVVEPIGEMLGADRVVATRMVVERRPLHRRDRVLRVRPDQGRGDQGAGRVRGVRPRPLLRLQRLGHRPADAGGGRPPARGEPGPGAAPGGGRTAAGRFWCSAGRCRCASACRTSRYRRGRCWRRPRSVRARLPPDWSGTPPGGAVAAPPIRSRSADRAHRGFPPRYGGGSRSRSDAQIRVIQCALSQRRVAARTEEPERVKGTLTGRKRHATKGKDQGPGVPFRESRA